MAGSFFVAAAGARAEAGAVASGISAGARAG